MGSQAFACPKSAAHDHEGPVKPPQPFKFDAKRGYSQCIACDKWTHSNAIFRHSGIHWILCNMDYADYWENTEEIEEDYYAYRV